jgi:hypothetical protein
MANQLPSALQIVMHVPCAAKCWCMLVCWAHAVLRSLEVHTVVAKDCMVSLPMAAD